MKCSKTARKLYFRLAQFFGGRLSIKLLKEKGENGIRIGTCQGEPEKDTFEKFLLNYGQPERLGSYFPSVLSYLGLAIIFNKGRSLHIKIDPNASI